MGSQARIKEINQHLRKAGYRVTPQRSAILEYLVGNEDHPTIHDIHKHLRKQFPNIALSTIYKNLSFLEELGYIWELEIADDTRHYDASSLSAHPHLVCTHCEKIIDLQDEQLNHLIHQSCQKQGFKFVKYRFNLYGICPDCLHLMKKEE